VDVSDGHLIARLAEVRAVGDDPRLVLLDEVGKVGDCLPQPRQRAFVHA
jgi:hypothetical protein